MISVIFFSIFVSVYVFSFDREAVRKYALKYWDTPNHECGNWKECTPYAYFGEEICGYESHGGDCANFVSQCLIAGGHPYLSVKGNQNCRGYPCGKEEPSVIRLGNCLIEEFEWTSICGYLMPPPSYIEVGDVLIYHHEGCDDATAHAVVIVEVKDIPKIAGHSFNRYGTPYTYQETKKPYYQWLHKN